MTTVIRLASVVTVLLLVKALPFPHLSEVLLGLVLSHYFLGLVFIGRTKLSRALVPAHALRIIVVLGLAVAITVLPKWAREWTVIIHAILTDMYIGPVTLLLPVAQLFRFASGVAICLVLYRYHLPWLTPMMALFLLVVPFVSAVGSILRSKIRKDQRLDLIGFESVGIVVALLSLLAKPSPYAFWFIVIYHVVIWFWYPLNDDRKSTRDKALFVGAFIATTVVLWGLFRALAFDASTSKIIPYFAFAHILLSVVYSSQQPRWISDRVGRLIFPKDHA